MDNRTGHRALKKKIKILEITREKAQITYHDISTRSIVDTSAIKIKVRQQCRNCFKVLSKINVNIKFDTQWYKA